MQTPESGGDGRFFYITELWGLSIDAKAELLGRIPRSTFYRLRSAAGTRRVDEITRVYFNTVAEVIRKAASSEQTFYYWKTKYAELSPSSRISGLNHCFIFPSSSSWGALLDVVRGAFETFIR